MRILFDRFPQGRTKALTMSYDDGTVHDRRLVEIFNRHGIRGTFHLNSSFFGGERYIQASEVAGLFAGHEVSAHTATHPMLGDLPTDVMAAEILDDRRALEALVGYPVRGMSYPFGSYNDRVLAVLPTVGIEYARTVASTNNFYVPANLLMWHPTAHHNNNIAELGERFLNHTARWNMALMYVWGHSYEFDAKGNWQVIEDFCKQMGGHDSIWYATNAEIAAYVTALRALRFGASADLVHNPSAIPVWLTFEGKVCEIPAGTSLKLS